MKYQIIILASLLVVTSCNETTEDISPNQEEIQDNSTSVTIKEEVIDELDSLHNSDFVTYDQAIKMTAKYDYKSLPKKLTKELLISTTWSFFVDDYNGILYFSENDNFYFIEFLVGTVLFGTYSIKNDQVTLSILESDYNKAVEKMGSISWVIEDAFKIGDTVFQFQTNYPSLILNDYLLSLTNGKEFFAMESILEEGCKKIIEGIEYTIVAKRGILLADATFYKEPNKDSEHIFYCNNDLGEVDFISKGENIAISASVRKKDNNIDLLWYNVEYYVYRYPLWGWIESSNIELIE